MSNADLKPRAGRVWIGLGANIGDAAETFTRAREALSQYLSELQSSSLYLTLPYGDTDQDNFTNAVVCGYCELQALELLSALQAIEQSLGKRKLRPNGPRNIDLDILFWGDHQADLPGLKIPHPRAIERDFVLLPMQEIDPLWQDPRDGIPISELIHNLNEHYFTGTRLPWV